MRYKRYVSQVFFIAFGFVTKYHISFRFDKTFSNGELTCDKQKDFTEWISTDTKKIVKTVINLNDNYEVECAVKSEYFSEVYFSISFQNATQYSSLIKAIL